MRPPGTHPPKGSSISIQIKNSKALIDPAKLRLNILVYGLSGVGKTSWLATAPNVGVAACETGHGKGLLSIAERGVDYIEPTSLQDFEALVNGKVFNDKQTLALDSLSEMVNTFIKAAALAIPRTRGESDKRRRGIPELDDYGIMGEITRQMLRGLLTNHPDKHIIVTAGERYDKPDPENGQGEFLVGPSLPGQMFIGSTAMFDLVLRMRTRPKLRDPKDAKSKYSERYFITQQDGQGTIAKSRANSNGKSLLDKEEIFDPERGLGTFDYLLNKILNGYKESGQLVA